MDYTIIALSGQHPEFAHLMRPYLYHGAIEAELDGKVEDKPGKIWCIAVTADDRAIGFCGAIERDDETHFETFWVQPGRRRQGVGRRLFEFRLAWLTGLRPIRAWCSTSSRPLYLAHGFLEVDQGVHDGHDWWEMYRPA